MKRIKYLDKVWFPKDMILIDDTFTSRSSKFVCKSIKEMIKHLRSWYFEKDQNDTSSFFKISIYNLSAGNKSPRVITTYRNSKDILCKYAYHRSIYLSPNLEEVYSESFELRNANGRSGFYCTYDYGILYGDYPLYDNGDKIESEYLSKSSYEENFQSNKFTIYGSWMEQIQNLDSTCKLFRDIGIFYRVYNDIKKLETEFPFCEIDDGCIPVSTFTKINT